MERSTRGFVQRGPLLVFVAAIGVCLAAFCSACISDFSDLSEGTGDPTGNEFGVGGAGGSPGDMHPLPDGAATHPVLPEGGSSKACNGPEICNGLDDNCNGQTDEGCPTALSWASAPVDRPVLGGSTGGGFSDTCQPGEMLAGVHATPAAWVTQVTGICRTYSLDIDKSATPYRYTARLAPGFRTMDSHPPTSSGVLHDLECPDDRVLIGLKVSQQMNGVAPNDHIVIPSMWATCARLVVKDRTSTNGPGAEPQWQDQVVTGPVVGVSAMPTDMAQMDLIEDAQSVPVRLNGASGDWLDRVGIGTAKLRTDVGPTATGTVPDAGSEAAAPGCRNEPIPDKGKWTITASATSPNATDILSHVANGTASDRWSSGKPQAGDEWLQVDFGADATMDNVYMDLGADYLTDYPRVYEVRLAETPLAFTAPLLASGVGQSGTDPVIKFPAATGRYLLISQTGSAPANWWSVAELTVSNTVGCAK